jgi:hypothetical protein
MNAIIDDPVARRKLTALTRLARLPLAWRARTLWIARKFSFAHLIRVGWISQPSLHPEKGCATVLATTGSG